MIYESCRAPHEGKFFIYNGYIYYVNKLCIPICSIYELLLKESHYGGLMGYLGISKIYTILHEHSYWPRMKRDVERFLDKCITCRQTKSKVRPHDLYTPLSIPKESWVDLSINFILGLSRSKKGNDSIYVVVNRFSKMAYFITCHKTDNTSHIVDLFFWEIVRLHGILKSIVSDRDVKFLNYSLKILWSKLGTKLLFLIGSHCQTDGQTKIVSRTFSSLLRAILHKILRAWEECLPRIEFTNNRTMHSTT